MDTRGREKGKSSAQHDQLRDQRLRSGRERRRNTGKKGGEHQNNKGDSELKSGLQRGFLENLTATRASFKETWKGQTSLHGRESKVTDKPPQTHSYGGEQGGRGGCCLKESRKKKKKKSGFGAPTGGGEVSQDRPQFNNDACDRGKR